MNVIYVGDSKDVIKRIVTMHCRGNVESSAIRAHVAVAMGYILSKTRRTSSGVRIRIDLLHPGEGESAVSQYMQSGEWKYVICESYKEAHDFQWYAIKQLNPIMNPNRQQWNRTNMIRHEILLTRLVQSQGFDCAQLRGNPTGPGVYVLSHQEVPQTTIR